MEVIWGYRGDNLCVPLTFIWRKKRRRITPCYQKAARRLFIDLLSMSDLEYEYSVIGLRVDHTILADDKLEQAFELAMKGLAAVGVFAQRFLK